MDDLCTIWRLMTEAMGLDPLKWQAIATSSRGSWKQSTLIDRPAVNSRTDRLSWFLPLDRPLRLTNSTYPQSVNPSNDDDENKSMTSQTDQPAEGPKPPDVASILTVAITIDSKGSVDWRVDTNADSVLAFSALWGMMAFLAEQQVVEAAKTLDITPTKLMKLVRRKKADAGDQMRRINARKRRRDAEGRGEL